MPVDPGTLFAWHERPGAFERLSPPWENVRVVERTGTIRDGDRTVLEMRIGPLRRRWVAVHEGYRPGAEFTDVQESGPFAEWRHVHRALAGDAGGSVLEDDISYRLPGGPVGKVLGGRIAERRLEQMFRFRHARTLNDLTRHAALPGAPMRIAVTGASGTIGTALTAFLTTGGHEVHRLVRGRATGPGEIAWDPAKGEIDAAALDGLDAVVHLSGEPIPRRWSEARKRAILESRRDSTRLLAETLARLPGRPRVLISASGTGYYGSRGDDVLTEASEGGSGFLADVCRAWESATAPASDAGIRTVCLRTGVVVTAAGGMLAKLLPPFRAGVGGRVGSGRQWIGWISLEDMLGAILFLLRTETIDGAVNLCAPNPVTNAGLTTSLARVVHRPAVIPLPAAAVGALFGEMGRETLLASQRAVPERLTGAGFRFLYPELEPVLRSELGKG